MPSLTVKPSDGGQLITRAASADVGVPHYTVKRNIRRDLTDEILTEGHDYFVPLPAEADALDQPFPAPSGESITLVHKLVRPNGQVAIIVGTPTTLYRLNTDLGGYIRDGYIADGYFADVTRWTVIGSGFFPGRRWEAVDVNGTTILNNGWDLPVAYRVEWSAVKPLYELREQGIVTVGTIAEFYGLLLCGDVTELRDEDYDTVLAVVTSGTVPLSQSGFKSSGALGATSDGTTATATGSVFEASDAGRLLVWSNGKRQRITGYISATQVTLASGDAVAEALSFRITDAFNDASRPAYLVTATGDFFTADMVGAKIGWAGSGDHRQIVEVLDSRNAYVDCDFPVSSGVVSMDNPLAYLPGYSLPVTAYNRRQCRLLWGEMANPERFETRATVNCDTDTRILTTGYTQKSLTVGTVVGLDGGGVAGGALVTDLSGSAVKLVGVGPGYFTLSTPPLTTGENASLLRYDSIGSTAGYEDLQDDGAPILKAAPLQQRLVIYKTTNIFLARYTGDASAPLAFESIEVPHGRSLYFRNTVACIEESRHVYAGKSRLYQFDLTTRSPQPIGDTVGNVFFDYARLEDTESIYAADNHNTQEVWLVCPGNAVDPVLAFDYVYDTFATRDWAPTAAATLKGAIYNANDEMGDWFVMGTGDGTLLIYGLTTQPVEAWGTNAIYYRRSARPHDATKYGYSGRMESGLIHFGDAYNEKRVRSYVLQFSSLQGYSPNATVEFYTARNQSASPTLLGTFAITDADNHGLCPLHTIAHFVKDAVTITSTEQPMRLHMRTWDYQPLGSRSFHKRP